MTQPLHGDDGTSPEKPENPTLRADLEIDPAAATYTLKVLSTSPGEARRTVLFRRVGDGEAIEISAETDSPNLLAELPAFMDAALEIQRALWPAQRTVSRMPSSFFPLLAEHARLFRTLAAEGGRGDRALDQRRAVREAMIVRDVAWEALRGVLDPARRKELDALVGADEDPDELAASMDRIADLIDGMRADPRDAAILAVTDLDDKYATALRRKAGVLRAIEPAPSGVAPRSRRLFRLIGTAYRALRTEAFMTAPTISSTTRAREPSA